MTNPLRVGTPWAAVGRLARDLAGGEGPTDDLVSPAAAAAVARAEAVEGADRLQQIARIVVLVQENRSFDHLLGYLSLPASQGGRGRSDVDGLDLGRDVLLDPAGRPCPPFPLTDGVFLDNPSHTATAAAAQVNGGAMDGFVTDFADKLTRARAEHPNRPHETAASIMGYHTAATVPVYDFLAQHYTVCDRWHSAVPGPTWPNRMFLYAGTAKGHRGNGFSGDGVGDAVASYRAYAPTMPTDLVVHRVAAAGHTWGVYRGSVIPWMRFFPSFAAIPGWRDRVKPYRRFDADCRRGDLPDVTFIDPDSALGDRNDDQPPGDVARGQELVGDIYENLRRHGLLASTLFVIVYDEHGGFYDHVAPPDLPAYARTPPDAFTTYGVRVPALVVSAFTEPGSVFHPLLDHTTITNTILLRFGGRAALGPRVAVARNLGQLLTRATARPSLPSAADAVDAARHARSTRRGNPDPSTDPPAALVQHLLSSTG